MHFTHVSCDLGVSSGALDALRSSVTGVEPRELVEPGLGDGEVRVEVLAAQHPSQQNIRVRVRGLGLTSVEQTTHSLLARALSSHGPST